MCYTSAMSNNDNHKQKAFQTQIDQQPIVEHHTLENTPELESLREVLSDVGHDLQRIKAAPKEMEYLGSFSVHVYGNQGLKGTYAFVALTNPHKCFFKLAEAAGRKLMGDIQLAYRGRFQKKRSGFANG